jgi:hypothetical protein
MFGQVGQGLHGEGPYDRAVIVKQAVEDGNRLRLLLRGQGKAGQQLGDVPADLLLVDRRHLAEQAALQPRSRSGRRRVSFSTASAARMRTTGSGTSMASNTRRNWPGSASTSPTTSSERPIERRSVPGSLAISGSITRSSYNKVRTGRYLAPRPGGRPGSPATEVTVRHSAVPSMRVEATAVAGRASADSLRETAIIHSSDGHMATRCSSPLAPWSSSAAISGPTLGRPAPARTRPPARPR